MLGNFIGWLGFGRSTFSKKRELVKLKKMLSEVKWRQPTAFEAEEFSKISGKPVVEVAVTNIKEVAGIIDNRLRVFNIQTPEHFIYRKFTSNAKSEKDDYVIGFTEAGIKLLSKRGLKTEPKV